MNTKYNQSMYNQTKYNQSTYIESNYFTFTTKDNVKLNVGYACNKYKRSDKIIILIPGWSQTIEQYKVIWNNPELLKHYSIYAIDMRGHGQSEKVNYGYQVSRLAQDLYEFISEYNLQNITLMGHSLGCAIIWNYIQNYGEDNILNYIFIDQSITELPLEGYSDELGSTLSWFRNEKELTLYDLCNKLKSSYGEKVRRVIMMQLFTPEWISNNEEEFEYFYKQSSLLPLPYASDLFLNHAMTDWRTLLPRIQNPTLVIGGTESTTNYKSILYQASIIPDCQYYIFEEYGSHFMFIEDTETFIQVIMNFLLSL